jgi:hypothetical protein
MIDIIITDFGAVTIGPKTIAYMDRLDSKWREKVNNKRLRSKHVKYIRSELLNIETTAFTLASIEWCSGGILTTLP